MTSGPSQSADEGERHDERLAPALQRSSKAPRARRQVAIHPFADLFRRYRLLGTVVLFLLVAAWFESGSRDTQQNPDLEGLPYVMYDLYPDSPRVKYVLGVQSIMNGDLPQAKALFEEALATGEKTNEDLLYYYAVTLVRMHAPPDQTAAAVQSWQTNFPYSDRPDPRATSRVRADSPQLRNTQP